MCCFLQMNASDLQENLKKLHISMAFLIKHSQKIFRVFIPPHLLQMQFYFHITDGTESNIIVTWHCVQIKSLLLSHHHSTCALVSEILESVLQKQFTYRQYILTYCTEDNVQNTYTQYTQCTIRHTCS